MMRIFFLVTFAANIVLSLVSWVILPDTVAIHFGSNGMPDSWSPVWFHVLIFLGMQLVLFVAVYFGAKLKLGLSSRWVNLPNKNYWLRDENLPTAEKKLTAMMMEFGAAMMLFLFVVGSLTLKANLSDPVRLSNEFFWPSYLVFMAFVVYWCVKFFFLFRAPREDLA